MHGEIGAEAERARERLQATAGSSAQVWVSSSSAAVATAASDPLRSVRAIVIMVSDGSGPGRQHPDKPGYHQVVGCAAQRMVVVLCIRQGFCHSPNGLRRCPPGGTNMSRLSSRVMNREP